MARRGMTICPRCGYEYEGEDCPLCDGMWECWKLQFAPLPLRFGQCGPRRLTFCG